MKRRRHTLQVSTFPFLAVLLCAMGSLILLLLVIDRRAKVVMRAKALAAIRQMETEDAKDSAARASEWEQRRRALHEQLQRQKQGLDTQSASLDRQLTDAAREIQTEQAQTLALGSQLQAEKENLMRVEKAVASGVHEANQKKEQSEAASKELTRLSTELIKLEQTLEDLKTLRQRQQQTYSLVLYRGRRGDNRRPIYLECAATSLVFHPDRLILPATNSDSSTILHEVERRISGQQPAGISEPSKPETPYLLLLVRPDGIVTYYRALAALRNLKVDFGYEFVESDWVLDFPQDDNASQSWMANGLAPPLSGGREPPEPASRKPQPSVGPRGSQMARGPEGEVLPTRSLALSPAPGSVGIGGSGQGTNTEAGGQVENLPPRLNGVPALPGDGDFRRLRHFASLPAGTGSNLPPRPGGVAANGPWSQGTSSAGPTVSGASQEQSGVSLGTARPRGVSFAGTGGSEGTTASDDQGKADSVGGGSTGERGDSSPPFLSSQHAATESFGRDPAGERFPSTFGNRSQFSFPNSGLETRMGGSGTGENPRPAGDANSLSKAASPDGTAPNGSSLANSTGAPSAPSLIPTFGAPPSDGSGRSGNLSGGANRAQTSEAEDAGPQLGSSSALSQLGAEREKKTGPVPVVRRYVRPEWNIFIECTSDHVIVYPGGLRIPANSLGGHGNGSQSLLKAIQQMIARRQAVIASSETDASTQPPQIRFLLRPDGLRTYFLAYPELGPLHLPMTRENLDANEDVVRHMMNR